MWNDDLSDLSKVLFIWWQIWNDRNDFVFNQIRPNPIHSFKAVTALAKNFLLANSKARVAGHHKSNSKIRWRLPDSDYHKINFDGSMVGSSAAAGFVIRNHRGQPCLAGSRNLGHNTITVAEALAARDAFSVARSQGLKKVKIEGDSKIVIEAITGKCSIPWRIRAIVEAIKWLTSSFGSITWKHILRETNFVVDVITSCGYGLDNFHVWIGYSPPPTTSALLFDYRALRCS